MGVELSARRLHSQSQWRLLRARGPEENEGGNEAGRRRVCATSLVGPECGLSVCGEGNGKNVVVDGLREVLERREVLGHVDETNRVHGPADTNYERTPNLVRLEY